MTHPTAETLWACADRADEAPEAVRVHLASCPECARGLAEARLARSLLAALPSVPPMPDELARRVGAALAVEADRRAQRGLRAWWTHLTTPRLLALAAAAVLVVGVAVRVARPAPSEVERPPAAATAATAATVQPALPGPSELTPVLVSPPAPPRRVRASISMARRARANDAVATKAQELEEGSTVTTETGGRLWMRLGDGTRAGLTGSTQVTLARLEEDTLTIDVARGSLALAVPHRVDRVVTVQAGEVQVRDLGTRFVVSRTDGRVVVAVSEGVVEVKTPIATRTVSAGHAASWHDGRLDALSWDAAPPPGTPAASPPTKESVARLDEDDEDMVMTPAPPAPKAPAPAPPRPPERRDASVGSEEEWAKLPPSAASTAAGPSRASGAPRELDDLEARLDELRRALVTPLRPSERAREAKVREVAQRTEREGKNKNKE